jgi:hypothetical protein
MLFIVPAAAPGLHWAITVKATFTPMARRGFDWMIRLKMFAPVIVNLQQFPKVAS